MSQIVKIIPHTTVPQNEAYRSLHTPITPSPEHTRAPRLEAGVEGSEWDRRSKIRRKGGHDQHSPPNPGPPVGQGAW